MATKYVAIICYCLLVGSVAEARIKINDRILTYNPPSNG